MESLIVAKQAMVEFYRPLSEGFNSLPLFARCHEYLPLVGCEFVLPAGLPVSITNENKMFLVLL